MFRDKKLGTTVVAHEELSKILREMDSITSALHSVIEAVKQTTIIGQDVRHRLDEHEVAFRRDVRAIHGKLDGVGIRIQRIEAHSRTPKGAQTATVTLCMDSGFVLARDMPITLGHLAVMFSVFLD